MERQAAYQEALTSCQQFKSQNVTGRWNLGGHGRHRQSGIFLTVPIDAPLVAAAPSKFSVKAVAGLQNANAGSPSLSLGTVPAPSAEGPSQQSVQVPTTSDNAPTAHVLVPPLSSGAKSPGKHAAPTDPKTEPVSAKKQKTDVTTQSATPGRPGLSPVPNSVPFGANSSGLSGSAHAVSPATGFPSAPRPPPANAPRGPSLPGGGRGQGPSYVSHPAASHGHDAYQIATSLKRQN